MKTIKILSVLILMITEACYAQQKTEDRKHITDLINTYSKSVIEKDSTVFYGLFNDGPVTWCAALKDNSIEREFQKNGSKSERKSYFSGTYQAFMRSLFSYRSSEDKFDNIQIIEDGTVASVSMDYSFWADNKMTNWGCKYLSLIKRDGKWKITSVIYSIELADYFDQPSLKRREKK
ncbi:MAG: nuclear transport factor 2 family protein [Mucilaginibacter sp.]